VRLLVTALIDGAIIHYSPITNQHSYGRGAGVGRGLGVGVGLGVALGIAVAVAVAVALGVGVGVGVGPGGTAQYLPPVFRSSSPNPPQTIISVPVQTAV
jgi:hypothetical protein